MSSEYEDNKKRNAILEGISQNISVVDISRRTGTTRREVVRIIRAMRRNKDPELREAEDVAEAENNSRLNTSQKLDNKFYEMTGLTFQEKTFQNMVAFYRPELISIVNTRDQDTAIRKLPTSVRKTLVRNNILTSKGKLEVTQNAIKYL